MAKQHHPRSTPADKEGKYLDLLGRKVFLSSNLQFRISSYQVLLAKYDFLNYIKFEEFANSFPQQDHAHFQAFVKEGKLIARVALQSALVVADTSSRTWLQPS